MTFALNCFNRTNIGLKSDSLKHSLCYCEYFNRTNIGLKLHFECEGFMKYLGFHRNEYRIRYIGEKDLIILNNNIEYISDHISSQKT